MNTEIVRDKWYQLNVEESMGPNGNHPEGASRGYGRTLLDNLPKVLGTWEGPCWLAACECYSSLQKGHEERPRETDQLV